MQQLRQEASSLMGTWPRCSCSGPGLQHMRAAQSPRPLPGWACGQRHCSCLPAGRATQRACRSLALGLALIAAVVPLLLVMPASIVPLFVGRAASMGAFTILYIFTPEVHSLARSSAVHSSATVGAEVSGLSLQRARPAV